MMVLCAISSGPIPKIQPAGELVQEAQASYSALMSFGMKIKKSFT